eukprot:SAG11_NODE_6557_length_1289_cov_1.422689_2_plen_69_part_00
MHADVGRVLHRNHSVGHQGAAKIMAKDLVRTRRHVTKFYQMKTHLQGVSLKLQVGHQSLLLFADELEL